MGYPLDWINGQGRQRLFYVNPQVRGVRLSPVFAGYTGLFNYLFGGTGAFRIVYRLTSMKMEHVPTCIAAFLLFAAACPIAGLAQQPRPGGYATASVTNKQVVAASAFAIPAQQNAMQQQQKKDMAPPKLELVTILQAEQQVVAGMNYRLKLKVKLNGKEKTAEAIVWWQAWRKPDPYQLTSWTWK